MKTNKRKKAIYPPMVQLSYETCDGLVIDALKNSLKLIKGVDDLVHVRAAMHLIIRWYGGNDPTR